MPFYLPCSTYMLHKRSTTPHTQHTSSDTVWLVSEYKNTGTHKQQPTASARTHTPQHSIRGSLPSPFPASSRVQSQWHPEFLHHFLYFPAPTPLTQAGPPAGDSPSPPPVKNLTSASRSKTKKHSDLVPRIEVSLSSGSQNFAHPFIKGLNRILNPELILHNPQELQVTEDSDYRLWWGREKTVHSARRKCPKGTTSYHC